MVNRCLDSTDHRPGQDPGELTGKHHSVHWVKTLIRCRGQRVADGVSSVSGGAGVLPSASPSPSPSTGMSDRRRTTRSGASGRPSPYSRRKGRHRRSTAPFTRGIVDTHPDPPLVHPPLPSVPGLRVPSTSNVTHTPLPPGRRGNLSGDGGPCLCEPLGVEEPEGPGEDPLHTTTRKKGPGSPGRHRGVGTDSSEERDLERRRGGVSGPLDTHRGPT